MSVTPRGPLAGIRVLDLSWGVAGPLGVLLLAELGADVVKVEPPGGDPFRAHPGYHVWNRSRRSVVADLRRPEGREVLLRLCGSADVLVEAFSPGTMARLGLSYEELGARFPRLVYCSVPAYPAGHRFSIRPGWDALVQARVGVQYEQPAWRPGPAGLHVPLPSMAAFFLAASGILAALLARERTGRGQHVRTSLLQGALAYTTQIWQQLETPPPRFRSILAKTSPPGIHQGSLYECARGEWIHAATMNGMTPRRSVDEILGLGDVDPGQMFSDPSYRAAHEELRRQAFRGRDRTEVVEEFHAAGLGAEAVVPMMEALRHPQFVANGMAAAVDDPELGPTTQIGVPVKLAGTPGAVVGGQPRSGEHTREILEEAGYGRDEVEALITAGVVSAGPTGADGTPVVRTTAPCESRAGQSAGPGGATPHTGPGPLAGVMVLDLGQYLAGPFGPMVLGDLGAEVIKVEPLRGDGMRMAGQPFIGCQRGKKDIAVDLKSEAGREIVMRLVERADVVHHNMTKGTAARLGVDYASLRGRNPDIIYCNTYAYGPEGPLSEFGGLDPLYQAACGLEYESGPVAAGNAPLYLRFGIADTANALASVVGVLAALLHRGRTGQGQEMWTSLLNAAALLSSDVFLVGDHPGPARPSLDARQTGTGPDHRLYEALDGWVQVVALEPEEWEAMIGVVGVPGAGRGPEDVARLEEAFRRRPAQEWAAVLDGAGVPVEVSVDTNDGDLALNDADNERLGLVTSYTHPTLGVMRQFGTLVDFSGTPTGPYGPPPLLGQHTREIMMGIGYTAGDVDAHIRAGVVYEPDEKYPYTH